MENVKHPAEYQSGDDRDLGLACDATRGMGFCLLHPIEHRENWSQNYTVGFPDLGIRFPDHTFELP